MAMISILCKLTVMLLAFCVASCGSKKINELEATNDTFNKKYSTKPKYRTMPMLNQLHNADFQSDTRINFYDIEDQLHKAIVEKNDEYFYQLIDYLQTVDRKTIDPASHEVLPLGNMYFLQKFLETTGTTNHTEQSIYFDYLKFLIQNKTDDYKKMVVDPIQTVVRNDSDNFVDSNFMFTREKVRE